MQYVTGIFLIMLILILSMLLYKQNRQMGMQREQMKALQNQIEQTRAKESEFDKMCDVIWDSANTIHLYAALSEESARDAALRQNQQEILRITQELLRLTET